MSKKRTYGEACGIPRALDRIGERWALLIVRELLLGPKRFTDIRAGLPGMSPDVLTQRLRELEQSRVVQKRKLPPPYAAQVYELTEWGRELEPVLIALGRWGARCPAPPEDMGMSLDSHVVSLQTLFDPARAEGYEARIELRIGEDRFSVEIADGKLEAAHGEAPDPNATVTTDACTLLALSHGHRELDEALAAGDAEIDGDEAAVARFFTLFPLPEPAFPELEPAA